MIDKAYLEITNGCNLACRFCHGTTRAQKSLTLDEFDTLTDRLRGQVKYLYFHLMGEPFSHPLLTQFVKTAREKGFLPMLTTNGTLLAQEGDTLLENPPYKISISLHAPAANPAFADENYLPACIDFAKKAAGRGVITVFRLWNLGGAEESGNAEILAALHAAYPAPWQKIRSGERLAEKTFLEWGREFDWPDMAAPALPADAPAFCFGLRDQIGILADGTVVPCCLDAEGTLALGNLFESPLGEILASSRARAIYDGFTRHVAVEPLCRRCGYMKAMQK